VRTASLALIAALAAAPLAAKPPAPADKPRAADRSDPREIYRGRGISVCVAHMRAIPDITPDELEALCGCAFDRFMPRWPTGALPPLAGGGLPPVLRSELLSCAAGQDSDRVAAVASRLAELPAVSEAPAAGRPGAPGPGFDVGAWLEDLTLPRLPGGFPLWALIPIALLAFVLFRALFRRRESGRDLMGPPAHMRRGGWPGRPPGL